MHKKAQGISMETIVVAVIVLFVLAVLLLVFTGRINIFGWGLRSCATLQGECSSQDCADKNQATLQTTNLEQGDKQGCAKGERWCCSTITADTTPK